jgi:hypothetical protein
MPAQTEPNSGIKYGYTVGESGWASDMDANLLWLGRAGAQLMVKDRDLATPPGSPANGDRYIVAASATGAWAGQDAKVAVWNGSAWVFYAPKIGWLAYIEDEQKITAYKATGWSAGLAI